VFLSRDFQCGSYRSHSPSPWKQTPESTFRHECEASRTRGTIPGLVYKDILVPRRSRTPLSWKTRRCEIFGTVMIRFHA
jgi:hypothetical protein